MVEDRKAGNCCSTFRIIRAVDESRDARLNHRPGAHCAGFDRHIECDVSQPVIPDFFRSRTKGDHLGVSRGIAIRDRAVSRRSDYLFPGHDYCTNRNFSTPRGFGRFVEREPHESDICVGVRHEWKDSSNDCDALCALAILHCAADEIENSARNDYADTDREFVGAGDKFAAIANSCRNH